MPSRSHAHSTQKHVLNSQMDQDTSMRLEFASRLGKVVLLLRIHTTQPLQLSSVSTFTSSHLNGLFCHIPHFAAEIKQLQVNPLLLWTVTVNCFLLIPLSTLEVASRHILDYENFARKTGDVPAELGITGNTGSRMSLQTESACWNT